MTDIDKLNNEELKQRIRVLENSRRVDILAAEHFRVLDNLQVDIVDKIIAIGHQHPNPADQKLLNEVIQRIDECFEMREK